MAETATDKPLGEPVKKWDLQGNSFTWDRVNKDWIPDAPYEPSQETIKLKTGFITREVPKNWYQEPSTESAVVAERDVDTALRISEGNIKWSLKSLGVNPKDAAKISELAYTHGLPEGFVWPHLVALEEEDRLNKALAPLRERFPSGAPKHPAALEFLQDPYNAAILGEKTQGLTKLEAYLVEAGQPLGTRVLWNLAQRTKEGVRGVLGAARLGVDTNPILGLLGLRETITDPLDKLAQLPGFQPIQTTSRNAFDRYLYDVVGMAPQIAATFLLGPWAVGLYIGGGQYQRLREEGISLPRAAIPSVVNAFTQMFLERLQFGKFMEFWKSPVKAGAKNLLTLGLTEFGVEWSQSYPDEITTLIAEAEKAGSAAQQIEYIAERLPQTLHQANVGGIREGLVVLPWAMIGGGGRIVTESAQAYIANRRFQAFDKALEKADELLSAGVPAVKVEEFMAKVAPEAKVYIEPEIFEKHFQDLPPEEFAQALADLDIAEAFSDATQDVPKTLEIDQSKWIHLSPETRSALANDIRMEIDGMSRNEQELVDRDLRGELSEQQQAIKEYTEQRRAGTLAAPMQRWRDQLMAWSKPNQKRSRFSADEVDSLLAILNRQFTTLAKRAGESMEELFERRNIRLSLGGDGRVDIVEGRQKVREATPIDLGEGFQEWFGRSVATEAGGAPLAFAKRTVKGRRTQVSPLTEQEAKAEVRPETYYARVEKPIPREEYTRRLGEILETAPEEAPQADVEAAEDLLEGQLKEEGYDAIEEPEGGYTVLGPQQLRATHRTYGEGHLQRSMTPLGEIDLRAEATQFFQQDPEKWHVDQKLDSFSTVNNRLMKELEVVERLIGPIEAALTLPTAEKKPRRSVFAQDLGKALYAARDSGLLKRLINPKVSAKKLADERKLKGAERKRFLEEVHHLRTGPLFAPVDKKGNPILSANGKAAASVDLALSTCQPTTPCAECYAAKAMWRWDVVRKAVRSTMHMMVDPKHFGRAVAAEVNKRSKINLPFVRLLGSGDMTSSEAVTAFNELAKYVDRPIHIFSRHHDNLAKLKGTKTAPFIKMGSLDADLYEFYGPRYLEQNLKKRGINNAWLYTHKSELPAIEALRRKGALGLILSASKKLHANLTKDLRMHSCPCDADERSFFASCRQCALSMAGCYMALADKAIDSNGDIWLINDKGAPDNLSPVLQFLYGAKPKKGRTPTAQAWAKVASDVIQKSISRLRTELIAFNKGTKVGIAIHDIRWPDDSIRVVDRKAYITREVAKWKKGGKKGKKPTLKGLKGSPALIYTTKADVVASVYTEIERLEGLKARAQKEGTFYLPGGEIQAPVAYKAWKAVKKPESISKEDAQQVYFQTEPDELGFFSALERSVEEMDFKSIPGKQLAARLKKTAGIKQEELEWTGVIEWLEEIVGKVTKDEVLDFLEAGGIKAQVIQFDEVVKEEMSEEEIESLAHDAFEDFFWQNRFQYDHYLPGEGLLVAQPEHVQEEIFEEVWEDDKEYWIERAREGEFTTVGSPTRHDEQVLPGGRSYREVLIRLPNLKGEKFYARGHWEESNIVVHFRLNDRIGPSGESVLFIEEIQSDWHKKGRESGYHRKYTHEDLRAEPVPGSQPGQVTEGWFHIFEVSTGDLIITLQPAPGRVTQTAEQAIDRVVAGPALKDLAPDAPFKKNAYALLAFKRILRIAAEEGYDAVAWTPGQVQADRYNLSKQVERITWNRKGDNVRIAAHPVSGSSPIVFNVAPGQEHTVVGKEVAEKIAKEQYGTLEGVDLAIGGEGMKGFYDRMLPKEVGKYIKRIDKTAKVLPTFVDGYEVWQVPLTEDIKASVIQGQPLFQEGGKPKKPRGRTYIHPVSREITMNLYDNADISTLLHEAMHVTIDEMKRLVESGQADAETLRDYKILLDFVGGRFDEDGHELAAKAYEAYFMLGRSPSPELDVIFGKIDQWLTRLYGSAKRLGVNVTDEVAGVFDRLLALEKEIQRAKEYYVEEGVLSGLYNVAAQDELENLRRARARAEKASRKKQLEYFRKAHLHTRRRMPELREQARREVDNGPLYRGIDEIVAAGGLSTDEVKLLYGQETVNRLKRHSTSLVKEAGTVALENLPRMLGQMSADAAIEAWLNAPKKADARALRLEQLAWETEQAYLEEIRGREATPGQTAYHTDERLESYIEELKILDGQLEEQQRKRQRPSARVLRAKARQIVRDMYVRDATQYTKAAATERRFRGEYLKALKRDDMPAANRAKWLEALQHAVLLEMVKAREKSTEILRRLKTREILRRTKNIEPEYREPVFDLVTTYIPKSGKTIRPKESGPTLKLPVLSEEMVGFLPEPADLIAPWVIAKAKPDNYAGPQDLTFAQLQDLDQAVTTIVDKGRGILKALNMKDAATILELVAKLSMPLDERTLHQRADTRKRMGKLTDLFRGVVKMTTRAEHIAEQADGYQFLKTTEFGPWREMVYRIIEAQVDKELRMVELSALLDHAHSVLAKGKERMQAEKGAALFRVEGAHISDLRRRRTGRGSFDPGMLFSVLLNSGNQNNLDSLLEPEGWTIENVDALWAQVSTEEALAIQEIWDIVNGLFDELDAVYYSLTRQHLVKEKALARTVTTRDGPVELRGGYYPKVFDPRINLRAGEYNEADLAKAIAGQLGAGVFKTARPASGQTKARLVDDEGRSLAVKPLMWDFGILQRHLDSTVHLITHAQVLAEADRATKNEFLRNLFVDVLGQEAYRAFRQMLSHVAKPHGDPLNRLDRIIEKGRQLTVTAILGGKVKTGLKQRLSLFNAFYAMSRASGSRLTAMKYLMEGFKQSGFLSSSLGLSSTEQVKRMFEKSKRMAARSKYAGDRDIRDVRSWTNRMKPLAKIFKIPGIDKEFTWADFKEWFFLWIRMNDMSAVAPLWYANYNMALGEKIGGVTEDMTPEQQDAAAIKFADTIVSDTQPTSLPVDQTELQADKRSYMKLFTSFMTYRFIRLSSTHLHMAAKAEGAITWQQLLEHFVMEYQMPAYAAMLFGALWAVALYDDDEKEKSLPSRWRLLTAPGEEVLSGAPILSDIVYGIRTGRDLPAPLALEGPARGGKAIYYTFKAFDDSTADAWLKVLSNTYDTVEYFSETPISNPIKDFLRQKKKMTGE